VVGVLKKAVLLLFATALLFFPTGCWDQMDPEELGIILTIALDQAPDGRVRLLAQIINPKALVGGGQGGGMGGGASISFFRNISSEGNTILECIRLLSLHAPSKLFFSHNQLVLISEELARNRDIEELMDFFDRNQQFRRNNWVLITRSDPSSIMGSPGVTQATPSQRIVSIIRHQDLNSFYPDIRLGEFIKNLEDEGGDVFAAGIQIEPNEAEVRERLAGEVAGNGNYDGREIIGTLIKLGGTAVFKDSRLVGWLNERESRGLLWIRGKVKGGEITVPCSPEEADGQNKSFSLEISRSDARLQPEISGEDLNVTVKINVTATVHEIECMEEVGSPAFLRSLEKGLASAVQVEVEAALAKAQQEYQSDVFGFGEAFYRKNPVMWGDLKPNWPEIYRNLPVYLEVDARVTRTGLITKPVEVSR